MRCFSIYNSAKRSHAKCAELLVDEATGEMRIVIDEEAAPSDLPLMLALFAERGQREVPDKWARKWVAERVPPQGRQNLGEILRAHGLDSYDEVALLAAARGRSAQDDFLIREGVEPRDALRVHYAGVPLNEDATSASPANSWCAVLGSKIAEQRKALGMTQRDLSEKTGIDQAAISRIESGRANPTLNTLEALVEGVGRCLMVKIV